MYRLAGKKMNRICLLYYFNMSHTHFEEHDTFPKLDAAHKFFLVEELLNGNFYGICWICTFNAEDYLIEHRHITEAKMQTYMVFAGKPGRQGVMRHKLMF